MNTHLPPSGLDHSPFAALRPSERDAILRNVVARLPFKSRLVSFVTSHTDRTYATVECEDTGTFVTYLVAFASRVHFENGHYGFTSQREATADMYSRAH